MAKIERKGARVNKKSFGQQMKTSLMTGISYMIPVVVAGGIIQAIAKMIGGYNVAAATGTFGFIVNQIGVSGMFFTVPVLCAAVAYSLGERAALVPGLALGYLSVQLNCGFIGGLLLGFMVGYTVQWMKNWKVPKGLSGLMPILIIPVFSTLVLGLAFVFVIGKPIAMLTALILEWMGTLQSGSKLVMGTVIGTMMGSDLGGPISKTACSFVNALNAEGVFFPTAAKICAGMTPPLGIALSVLLAKKKFNAGEIENAKAAVPLGCCFITEGALPFAISDPLRVIPCTMLGSAIAGGMVMFLGVSSPALHGGIFVIPMMEHPLYFVLSLAVGTIVTGVAYALLRRPLAPDQVAVSTENVLPTT